jgi:hypothetical protein
VIVHYLNFMRLAVSPDEADSPLVVDSDTVPSSPISPERFEPVTRGNPEFVQSLGGMDVEKFAPGHALDRPEPKHGPILEKQFGVMTSKRPGYSVNQNGMRSKISGARAAPSTELAGVGK